MGGRFSSGASPWAYPFGTAILVSPFPRNLEKVSWTSFKAEGLIYGAELELTSATEGRDLFPGVPSVPRLIPSAEPWHWALADSMEGLSPPSHNAWSQTLGIPSAEFLHSQNPAPFVGNSSGTAAKQGKKSRNQARMRPRQQEFQPFPWRPGFNAVGMSTARMHLVGNSKGKRISHWKIDFFVEFPH